MSVPDLVAELVAACRGLQVIDDEVVQLCKHAEAKVDRGEGSEALASALQAVAALSNVFENPDLATERDKVVKKVSKAVTLAKDLGETKAWAFGLLAQAKIQLLRGRPDTASRTAQDAIVLFQQSREKRGEADALCIVVDALFQKAEKAGSGEGIRQSEFLKKTGSEIEKEMQMLRSKFLDDAIRHGGKAVDLCRQVGDTKREAQALLMLANLQLQAGEFHGAIQYAEEASDLFADIDDYDGRAVATNMCIEGAIAAKDGNEALQQSMLLARMWKDVGDKEQEALAECMVLKVLYMRGELEQLISKAKEVQELFKALKDDRGQALVLDAVIKSHLQTDNIDLALAVAKETEDIFKRSGDRAGEAYAMHGTAQIQLDQFFMTFEDNLEEHKRVGYNIEEYEEPSLEGYNAGLDRISQAAKIFVELKDEEGQMAVKETMDRTIMRSTLLQDPEETKFIVKKSRHQDTHIKWVLPKPEDEDTLAKKAPAIEEGKDHE